MTRISRILAALCSLALPMVCAADVTIPHTFTSGTPARASDVNQNFSALKDGIDDTAAAVDALQAEVQALAQAPRGGLKVQVNGVTVGTLVGLDEEDNLVALTERGYFVDLSPDNADETVGGTPALKKVGAYFEQLNCQGTMFVRSVAMYSGPNIFFRQGIVFASPGPDGSTVTRFVKGTPAETVLRSAKYPDDDGVWICRDFDPSEFLPSAALVATMNDPSVTGVPDNLSGPVRITAN